jgi:hypothetical protein
MSRLGPEPSGPVTEAIAKARYGSRWAAAADRETGRRVWFSLVRGLMFVLAIGLTDVHA